jgi:ligand-binding SRPBCC domain-containing protein
MQTVIFETTLNAPIQKVYEFHCDTNNLPLITPPWIKVAIVKLDLPLSEGSHIILNISRFGFTQQWEMEIEAMHPNGAVIDRAIRSPFKSFRHVHGFEKLGENQTRMKDTVEFSLPLAPLSNIALPFIRSDFARMFNYRHEATAKALLN